MIANLTLEEFAHILQSHLASTPSGKSNHNNAELAEIEQALSEPGRTIFIYADDHTAKTSLANVLSAHRTLSVEAAHQDSHPALFIVDEFDQISSDEDRARFAGFVKQLEESRVPIHFLFCGVSDSLRELLADHESRYGDNLDLPGGSARFEVGELERNQAMPHYVHLVSEKTFCQMFNEPTFVRSLR